MANEQNKKHQENTNSIKFTGEKWQLKTQQYLLSSSKYIDRSVHAKQSRTWANLPNEKIHHEL